MCIRDSDLFILILANLDRTESDVRTKPPVSANNGRVGNATNSSDGSLQNTLEKNHTELVPYPY